MWQVTDPHWHHCSVCKQSTCPHPTSYNQLRHSQVLQKADVSSTELLNLLRLALDGKRPDGATLIQPSNEKYITWDPTTVHTPPSLIRISPISIGDPVKNAALRKHNKYYGPPISYNSYQLGLKQCV